MPRLIAVFVACAFAVACDLSGPSFGPSPFRLPPSPSLYPPPAAPTAPAPDVRNPEPIHLKTAHLWGVYWISGQPHGDPDILWDDDLYGPPPVSAFNHSGHGGCPSYCMDQSTVAVL